VKLLWYDFSLESPFFQAICKDAHEEDNLDADFNWMKNQKNGKDCRLI
jgi:hypothetical protein